MDKKIIIKGKPIPKFKSYEEEADFWDTHSTLDYGTWREVKLEVAKPLGHILGIRLDAKTIDQLSKQGQEIGVGASTLARMWIMEKLKSLEKKRSSNFKSSKQSTGRAVLHKNAK